MMAVRLVGKLRATMLALCAARGGNIVVPFALLMVPIMGLVGAAVDYGRANSDKAAMQAAIDSTAMMMSKNITTLTATQINQEATNYFNSLFHRPDVTNVLVTPNYSTAAGTQIVLTATGTVATTFMKVMGYPTLTISASTTVKWGNSRLRVALVLDNTGSMAQSSKMTALKTAAKNLLTQLQGAATQNGDVYVSIIPFAKDVNAGPTNYNESWVKWSGAADTWDERNGTCSKSGYNTKSACVAQGTCSKAGYTTQSTCVAQGTCSKGNYNSQSSCLSHDGTWTLATWTPATWSPKNHNTWTGCVMDRDQNYDTTNDAPTAGNPATLFPAEQYSSYCPTPVMGPSYDWTALAAKIDAMMPKGATNQAVGLQWGYQSLTSAPFTIPAMDPNYKYQKVIVLLTDGLNTQDRWYGNGYDWSQQVDARQQILCDNINAAGITLYAVQVNTAGDPTSTLLQKCAGSPGRYPDSDKFFLLTSANQIVTTFAQIGTQLSNLRVAK